MNTSKKTFELIAVVCTIIGIGLFAGCQKSDGPENPLSGRNLAVYGEIFTADPSESIAKAFVVKDGKFVYVGSRAGAAEYITPDMKVRKGYEYEIEQMHIYTKSPYPLSESMPDVYQASLTETIFGVL